MHYTLTVYSPIHHVLRWYCSLQGWAFKTVVHESSKHWPGRHILGLPNGLVFLVTPS